MKNRSFFPCLLWLVSSPLLAQNNSNACLLRLDSVVYTLVDTSLGDYRMTGRNAYQYDALDRRVYYLEERGGVSDPFHVEPVILETTTYPASNQRDILTRRWDASQNQWNNESLNFITYSPDGQLAAALDQRWDPTTNTWVNNARSEYLFYSGGGYQFQFFFLWDTISAVWDTIFIIEFTPGGQQQFFLQLESEKRIYTYNANEHLMELIEQKWVGNTWQNVTRHSYAYDSQMRLIDRIIQSWNPQLNAWGNQARSVNRFLNDYALPDTSTAYSWLPGQGTWSAFQKKIYEIQSDTHRIAQYNWYAPLGIWRFNTRTDSIFNQAGRLTDRYDFKGEQQTFLSWVNYQRYQLNYNSNGRLSGQQRYIWDAGPQQWKIFEDQELTYFPDDSLAFHQFIHTVPDLVVTPPGFGFLPASNMRDYYEPRAPHPIQYEYYDTPDTLNGGWIPGTLTTYFYSECGAVNTTATPESKLSVCFLPNPFYPGNAVYCKDCTPATPLLLQIFDLNGRCTHSVEVLPGQPLVSRLPSGYHAVRVLQEGQLIYTGMIYFAR